MLKGSVVARCLPFLVYILFLSLNHPLTSIANNAGLDARWFYAIRIACVVLVLAWMWREYSELKWSTLPSTSSLALSLSIGVSVFALWIMPYPDWARFGSSNSFVPTFADGSGIDMRLVAMRITGAALVVPVMEELFWRSYLMRWIDQVDFLASDPARISLRAFIITAVLFALEHSLWLAGLLAGIAYGWLYMTQRNLWAPVLAHATTNSLLGFWVLYSKEWHYW